MYLLNSIFVYLSLQVEIKDRVICTFCKQLQESENQHQEAMSRHFIMMDNLIGMHDVRKQVLFSYSIIDFLSLLVTIDASKKHWHASLKVNIG
jgi:hypothetical protein